MNYKYVLTETTYHDEELTRKSYGIATISTEDHVMVLGSIEDVAVEKTALVNLVNLCNREQLEHSQ